MLHLLFIALGFLAILVVMFLFFLKKHRESIKQKQIRTRKQSAIDKSIQFRLIAEKIDLKLKTEKIYTNPDLSIQDLAAEIGTNRSYISLTINKFYNQNFCTYINHYRFQELAETIINEEIYSYKELAMKCGFGSIDSMKRTVKLNTGLSLREWIDYLKSENKTNLSYNLEVNPYPILK